MNPQTLCATLNSISFDSHKNDTLKNLLPAVQGFDWSHISGLIGCYSDDSAKVKAIELLISKPLTNYKDDYVPKILNAISFDSYKVNALDRLATFIVNPSGSVISGALSTMSSDSDKCKVVAIIIKRFKTLSDTYVKGILDKISFDSHKVNALDHLSGFIINPSGSIISDALSTMSSDSEKCKVVAILVKRFKTLSDTYVKGILDKISFDSHKVTALGHLSEIITNPSGSMISSALSTMSSDSDKCKAIAILIKQYDTLSDVYLKGILDRISFDSHKVNALKIIVPKINTIDDDKLIEMLQTMSDDSNKTEGLTIAVKKTSNISAKCALAIIDNINFDSHKINGLNAIVPKMVITFESVFNILKNISSDDSTLLALKTFIDYGFVSNELQLIDLLSTVTSSSFKSEVAISLCGHMETISDHDTFCKLLASANNDQDNYLKVASKLSLNDEYVQKYKPENNSFSICIDNISLNSNSCDVSIPVGVHCASFTSVMSNGERHEVRKYSNGMVVETRKTKDGSRINVLSM